MDYNRKKEIEKAAYEYRKKCAVADYGIIDLFGDCKRSGILLFRAPLEDDNGLLGFAKKQSGDFIIFTNSKARLSREIFTLAHEIGHVQLHLNKTSQFFDNPQSLNSDELKEQEANHFAACLLMPEDKVSLYFNMESIAQENITAIDIAKIMTAFNVSFDMALNRLENLGIITSSQKAYIDTQKNEMRVNNLLRMTGGSIILNAPFSGTDIPTEFLEYCISNYNRKAIPKDTLERTLTYYRLTMDDIRDGIQEPDEEDDCIDDDDEKFEEFLRGIID